LCRLCTCCAFWWYKFDDTLAYYIVELKRSSLIKYCVTRKYNENILWIDVLQGNGFETFEGGRKESGAKLGDVQVDYNQHRDHDCYRIPILYAKLKNNCCTWPSIWFGAVCPWSNLSEDRKYLFQHKGLLSCGSDRSKFRLRSLTMLIRMPFIQCRDLA